MDSDKTYDPHAPRRSGRHEIRCNGCRTWFSAENGDCPECGHSRPSFNKWLRTAELNDNLLAQPRQQREEVAFVKKAYEEYHSVVGD